MARVGGCLSWLRGRDWPVGSGSQPSICLVRIHFIAYRLAPVGAVESWESWFRLLRGSADRSHGLFGKDEV